MTTQATLFDRRAALRKQLDEADAATAASLSYAQAILDAPDAMSRHSLLSALSLAIDRELAAEEALPPEPGKVQAIVNGLADRVAVQSELLSGRAERTPASPPPAFPAVTGDPDRQQIGPTPAQRDGRWETEVRDPAQRHWAIVGEGWCEAKVKGGRARYVIVGLPSWPAGAAPEWACDGAFALRYDLERAAPLGINGIPWQAYATHQAALSVFLDAARQHFAGVKAMAKHLDALEQKGDGAWPYVTPDPWEVDRAAVAKASWDLAMLDLHGNGTMHSRLTEQQAAIVEAANRVALACGSQKAFDAVIVELRQNLASPSPSPAAPFVPTVDQLRHAKPLERTCEVCGVCESHQKDWLTTNRCSACGSAEPWGRLALAAPAAGCTVETWTHPDGRATARALPGQLGNWHSDDSLNAPQPTTGELITAIGQMTGLTFAGLEACQLDDGKTIVLELTPVRDVNDVDLPPAPLAPMSPDGPCPGCGSRTARAYYDGQEGRLCLDCRPDLFARPKVAEEAAEPAKPKRTRRKKEPVAAQPEPVQQVPATPGLLFPPATPTAAEGKL